VGKPFPEALRRSNKLEIQAAALLMVALPHVIPERLACTQHCSGKTSYTIHDLPIMRIDSGQFAPGANGSRRRGHLPL